MHNCVYVHYCDLACFCEINSTRGKNKVFLFALSDSFDSNHGVCVLRMIDGLDIRDELETEGICCVCLCLCMFCTIFEQLQ